MLSVVASGLNRELKVLGKLPLYKGTVGVQLAPGAKAGIIVYAEIDKYNTSAHMNKYYSNQCREWFRKTAKG